MKESTGVAGKAALKSIFFSPSHIPGNCDDQKKGGQIVKSVPPFVHSLVINCQGWRRQLLTRR